MDRELVTTVLDLLGLLTVAAGTFFALAPTLGWAALLPAGLLVMVASAWWGNDWGSRLVMWAGKRRAQR